MLTEKQYYAIRLKRFESTHLPYINLYHNRTISTGHDSVTGKWLNAGDVVSIGQYLSKVIPKWELLKELAGHN